MTINNLRKQKLPAVVVTLALLFTMFGSVQDVSAAVTAAPTGTSILTQNGGTVVTTFSPALGPTITATTTGATAYYGVRVVSSTSSPDVFWEITVSHATSTLAPGMVSITEKGWFDATGNAVADSPYVTTVSGGDLVLSGNSGWSVASGDDFTNVDEISFSTLAPIGTYTVTRQLMDTASGTPIDAPYSFMVDLIAPAAPDTTSPSAPVITSGRMCSTTNTGTVSGTAEPGSAITIVGNGATTTATTTSSGNWSMSLSLQSEIVNSFSVTATDASGNVSAATPFEITQDGDCAAFVDNGGGGGGGNGNSNNNGNNNDNSPATSSVLGGSVDGNTTFVSPVNPFQQVLGASSFIPGIPNTGAGGKAPTNIALLLTSLGLVAIGTQVLRRRSQRTQ